MLGFYVASIWKGCLVTMSSADNEEQFRKCTQSHTTNYRDELVVGVELQMRKNYVHCNGNHATTHTHNIETEYE